MSDQSARSEWASHWPVALATASGMALAALLSAVFGVILEPMQNELGWSRAEISTGPVVVSIMGLFLAAPAGYLIDKLGSRVSGVIVIFTTFAAIVGMSQVGDEIWQWWAAWSIFGISGSFTSTVWMAPVSTIFNKGRGMAIAATICGASVSSAAAPPIAEYFVQHYDWRTALLALGTIWCGIVLPLVLLFVPGKRAAKQAASAEAGDRAAQDPLADAGGFTPREGFRSRNFHLIFLASLISGLAGLALILNLIPVLTFTGISRGDAVMIAGIMGIASLIGRLIGGWLMDNFDVRKLAIGAAVLSVLFPLTLIIAPGVVWAAMVALIFNGLIGGLKMSAVVYLTSTHLGARSFGLFYGTISTSTTVAQGVGPLVANYIFDMTQSYTPVIWAAIPGYLLTALFFMALGPAPDFGKRAPAH